MSLKDPTVGLRADAPGHVPHVPLRRYEAAYFALSVTFVGALLLTNIIGTKLFQIRFDVPILGPIFQVVDRFVSLVLPGQGGGESLTLTAGIITYPLTFLITDIVSEIYGRKRADFMVWAGFAASIVMLGIVWFAKWLPPSAIWNIPEGYAGMLTEPFLVSTPDGGQVGSSEAAQNAYRFAFDAPGILLFASMSAYLVSQLVDNRLFHFWRRVTKGKWLWFRNNASTSISQLVDTIIVNSIFLHFYWELPAATIAAIIIAAYAAKVLTALGDTPLCYVGIGAVRRLLERG